MEDGRAHTAQNAYAALMQARNVDAHLTWTRTTVMLAVQSAVLVAVAAALSIAPVTSRTWWLVRLVVVSGLSTIGYAVATEWRALILKGHAWRDYWIAQMARVEHAAFGDLVTAARDLQQGKRVTGMRSPTARIFPWRRDRVVDRPNSETLERVAVLLIRLWLVAMLLSLGSLVALAGYLVGFGK